MREDKALQIIGLAIAIPLMAFAVHENLWAEPAPPKPVPAFTVQVEDKKSEAEILLEIETMRMDQMTDKEIGDELDMELLIHCVEAEAGNQSILGKRLVVDVILNRVDDPRFPDRIADVIRQPGQFAVVDNGAIYMVTPSQETRDAVCMERQNRIDRNIVYFNTGGYPGYGIPFDRVGDHYFSM